LGTDRARLIRISFGLAAVMGLLPYAPMELAGFTIGGAWLIVFVGRTDRLRGRRQGIDIDVSGPVGGVGEAPS
jgi:hypothetical protein